ncbi:MAG TPA: CBS domain-containing protein [Caldisericia bacterium]|nr:CBS domain-containing protein [Caldisericia bacterium]
MNLIVTHSTADFDALASLVLAGKIFPNSICLIPSFSSSVYSFFSLYGSLFENLKNLKDIDLSKIDRVIMVDTQYPDRVTGLKEFIENHPKVLIIDHHYPDEEVKINAKRIVKEVGATISILTHMIKKKNIDIKPLEASLFALGIYEDTGNLLFITTKPYDIEALSFIFNFNVDLKIVHKYLITYLTDTQKKIFEKILANLKVVEINGYKIGISMVKICEYTEGVGFLVHKVLELFDLEAIFSILILDKKTIIIGRSRTEDINVKKILSFFGGGGHKTAASANFDTLKKTNVYNKLIKLIKNNVKIKIYAKDIMSTPVRTIDIDSSLEEAKNIMLRFNFSGLPVTKNGKIIGIITRSEISKVELLGLTNFKVKDFMIEKFIFVTPDTSLEDIEKIMVEKNIGRIPVVVKGKVVGIITRSDILRGIYLKNEIIEPYKVEASKINKILENNLSYKTLSLIKKIGRVADEMKINAYLVGGFVRDTLLNLESKDIDIVIEGDSILFSQELKKILKTNIHIYPDFKTATLNIDDLRIDIASSRREYYKEPASLPRVEMDGNIKDDLLRRDFTINTLAICINKNCFGNLIDLLNGFKDLEEKKIRVLHNLSFIDDPTRILRAVRYSVKLNFKIEKETKNLIKNTIKTGLFTDAKNTRIKEELFTILNDEKIALKGLKLLKSLGGLKLIHRKLLLTNETIQKIEFSLNIIPELNKNNIAYDLDSILFFMLISELNDYNRKEIIERWNLKKDFIKNENFYLDKIEELKKCSSKYEVFNCLKNLSLEELIYLLYLSEDKEKEKIKEFIYKLSNLKIKLKGKDLISMGFEPSRDFKYIFEKVKEEVLNGNLHTLEDEVNFVIENFGKEGKKYVVK